MDKKDFLMFAALFAAIVLLALGIRALAPQENVHSIDVGVGTFNCSENINFTLTNSSDGFKEYTNENKTYYVKVIDFKETSFYSGIGYNMALDYIRNYSSSSVDGVTVYKTTANIGKYIGEERHMALIDNNEKNISIIISTPSVDDTVEIASSFKFYWILKNLLHFL